MNKLIIIILLVTLVSCGSKNTVTLTKEEYSKLKGDTFVPIKTFTFKHNVNTDKKLSVENFSWEIVLGQDNHEYITNDSYNGLVVIHYPDCIKCLKRDSLCKQN